MGDAISSDNDFTQWARAAQTLRGGAIGGALGARPPIYAFDKVASILQRAETLSARVAALVDKLIGDEAAVEKCGSVPPRPQGLIYGLIDDADRADRRISDALSALTRLESIVGAHNVR